MEALLNAAGAFVHIRIAWDGLHVDVNLILLLMIAVVWIYWKFTRMVSREAADFGIPDERTDWRGGQRNPPGNRGEIEDHGEGDW